MHRFHDAHAHDSQAMISIPGMGEVSFWAEMYALCRKHGMEDDILVLSSHRMSADKISNSMNPFAPIA